MDEKVIATYQAGLLVLEGPLDLPEGARVEVTLGEVVALPEQMAEGEPEPNGERPRVQGPHIIPPSITDPEERARRLKALVERMENNPIPADAPVILGMSYMNAVDTNSRIATLEFVNPFSPT